MLFELTMRRRPPSVPANSPVDGIRILALLPDEWRKDLKQATGDVVIRVHVNDGTTNEEVRSKVAEILADPAVSHWEMVSSDILTISEFEAKD